jgi:hypothetical protein
LLTPRAAIAILAGMKSSISAARWLPLVCLASVAAFACRVQAAELVEVKKIWDAAPSNAFTDLLHFKGRWYCVFREAQAHVSPDGKVRVLSSKDGDGWESAALIELDGFDLRDPKITPNRDGRRLMILGGATVREGNAPATASQSFVTFSKDGKTWGDLQWAGPTNHWLWRVTWQKKKAYGIAYNVSPERRNTREYGTSLLQSSDGVNYSMLVPRLYTESGPTEATLRFARDGTLYCLQRRDGRPINTALLGTSKPPYTEWQWQDLGVYFGGPNFIQVPDGRWIAAGRLTVEGKSKTVVCELDVQGGELKPLLVLPSGGDTSYPGLVWHKNLLWISYYSAHEDKTSVYLAKVKLARRNTR